MNCVIYGIQWNPNHRGKRNQQSHYFSPFWICVFSRFSILDWFIWVDVVEEYSLNTGIRSILRLVTMTLILLICNTNLQLYKNLQPWRVEQRWPSKDTKRCLALIRSCFQCFEQICSPHKTKKWQLFRRNKSTTRTIQMRHKSPLFGIDRCHPVNIICVWNVVWKKLISRLMFIVWLIQVNIKLNLTLVTIGSPRKKQIMQITTATFFLWGNNFSSQLSTIPVMSDSTLQNSVSIPRT